MDPLSDLEQSIYRTVAWFSMFQYPLTRFEVWKWMMAPARPYTLSQVDEAVESSVWLSERLERQGAHVALAGNNIPSLVRTRHRKFLDAMRKFAKVQKIAAYFSMYGDVRAVAACNSLAWYQTGEESDIDLFILTRPGSLWRTRLSLVTPFALLGKRPGVAGARDPLCFSFFLADNALDLSTLRIGEADPYLALWSASLVPLLDRDGVFARLAEANAWQRAYVPHAPVPRVHEEHACADLPPILPHAVPESAARRTQERRFPAAIRHLMNQDTRVVVNDQMLKFHETDRRAEFCARWTELCAVLNDPGSPTR